MSETRLAWGPVGGSGAIKRCPVCGSVEFEGMEHCSQCGSGPFEDRHWRFAATGRRGQGRRLGAESRYREALEAIASLDGDSMSDAGDAVDIARDALEGTR